MLSTSEDITKGNDCEIGTDNLNQKFNLRTRKNNRIQHFHFVLKTTYFFEFFFWKDE